MKRPFIYTGRTGRISAKETPSQETCPCLTCAQVAATSDQMITCMRFVPTCFPSEQQNIVGAEAGEPVASVCRSTHVVSRSILFYVLLLSTDKSGGRYLCSTAFWSMCSSPDWEAKLNGVLKLRTKAIYIGLRSFENGVCCAEPWLRHAPCIKL